MRPGSLRFKLIAWNLGVLAVAIVGVSTVQSYTTVSRLERDIDNGLSDMAHHAAGMGPPEMRGGRGSGEGRGPQGIPMGPGEPPDLGRGPDGPPMDAQMRPPGPPPGMVSDVRRPRFFDMQRKPVGSFRQITAVDPEAIQRALQGWSGFTTLKEDRLRVYTTQWFEEGHQGGVVQVAHELRDVDLLRQGQMHTLLLVLPAALLIAGVSAFFLAERALRPIGALTRTAKAITASDLSERLEVKGDDEFADLGRTFNEMIARLDTSFSELKKTYADLEEAYDRQRQFTADASHELRTPLTRLKLATSSALSSDGSPDAYKKAVEVADKAAASMARLIEQLLMLAKADAGSLSVRSSPLDLRVVASEAVSNYPTDREIQVSFAKEPVDVLGDEELLGRVVTNLLENALRHSEYPVVVAVYPEGEEARMVVEDRGEGIPRQHMAHLFDRFYRADASRTRSAGGTGLGLSICKSIVEAHKGRIEVSSDPGMGTIFTIFLPILKKAATQTKSS
jgi:signal transduction histidine kinase